MTAAQRTMLFSLFARIAKGRSANERELLRERLTTEVFGRLRSWSTFGNSDVDRMKAALSAELASLSAAVEDEAYRTHDAAQAAHVPVVQPGKREQAKRFPRTHATRYEARTSADDPGQRRRLVFWIGGLFEPSYIRALAVDLDDTAAWEALPIPQLLALKETLKHRLGRWLTKHKADHDFGFSIRSRNPRSTTGWMTNEQIIGELLSRGQRVDMREQAAALETLVEESF